MEKKLGFVKWFGGKNSFTGKINDFGYIENIGGGDIRVYKRDISSPEKNLFENSTVIFDLCTNSNGKTYAGNVTVISGEERHKKLIAYFQENMYDEKIFAALKKKSSMYYRTWQEFISGITDEDAKKYLWIFDTLPDERKILLMQKMYEENPTVETEEKILELIKNTSKKFDLPLNLAINPKFRKYVKDETKIEMLLTHFDKLSENVLEDALWTLTYSGKKDKIKEFIEQHLYEEKIFNSIKESFESLRYGNSQAYYDYLKLVRKLITDEDAGKYSWLFDALSIKRKISLLSKKYEDNPTAEIAKKIFSIVEKSHGNIELLNDFLPKIMYDEKIFTELKNSCLGYWHTWYEFLNSITAKTAKDAEKYSWLFEALPDKRKKSLLLKKYEENPTVEIEEKILSVVENSSGSFELPLNFLQKNMYEEKNFSTLKKNNGKYGIVWKNFIDGISDEDAEKYSWLFDALPTERKVSLLSKMYEKNPAFEIEEKIFGVVENKSENFDFPPSLAIKPQFWKYASDEIKIEILLTHFDKIPEDMLETALSTLIKINNQDTLRKFIEQHLYEEKIFNLLDKEFESYHWMYSRYLDYLNLVRELITDADAEKYSWLFDVLQDERKFSLMSKMYEKNPTVEIEEKFSSVLKNLSGTFDLPKELVLKEKFWEFSSDEIKFKTFKQRAKELSAEELTAVTTKLFESTNYSGELLQFLRDNPKILATLNFTDQLKILFVYAMAKNSAFDENLLKLADLNNGGARVKIIGAYLKASQAKDNFERQKFFNEAENIFNSMFKLDTNNIENFPNLNLILPACKRDETNFCEARLWPTPEDIQNDFQTRGYNVTMRGYCPRISETFGNINSNGCIRLAPHKNLPLKEWALPEFFEVLDIQPTVDKVHSREFVAKLCGAFNRLYELRERLKCRLCGKYMKFDNYYSKLENLAVYMSTVAECKDSECKNFAKKVYLNHCWNCHKIIDSRDCSIIVTRNGEYINTRKISPDEGGYYLCIHCGAGIKGDKDGLGKICPKCGSTDMEEIQYRRYRYKCKKCSHVINTHWD